MSHSQENATHLDYYSSNMSVTFGNGEKLLIFHMGHSLVSNKLLLSDVLVIPILSKNIMSSSKLTLDYPVDVLFSQLLLKIQDRESK